MSRASRPPNIILTIADDQRGTALGCAGVEPVQTPHLDRLAGRGTRFSQAQHFGSCHGAICAPSRAMLHLGVPYFGIDHALMGPLHPPDGRAVQIPPTLGQRLREAGYHTFAVGKWHNGAGTFHASFDSGAQILFGGMAGHWFAPVQDFDPTGVYRVEDRRTAEGFSTEVFAQAAIDFIRSRRKSDEQPFLCYCAFSAPHDPRTPPDHWRRQYDPRAILASPNIRPEIHCAGSPRGVMPEFDPGTLMHRDELLLGMPRDWAEIQRAIAEYYGMVSHMDEWIGKIHQAAAEADLLEDTIVIHTADHGLALGQHGLLGKQNPFQPSLSVPLIMAGPGIPNGEVSDALCYQHDLYPTLLERAGMSERLGAFESLNSLLDGNSKGRSHIGNAYEDLHRAMRDSRHKLIESNVGGIRSTRLYDLVDDPWEMRNLAGEEHYQAIVDELRAALREWQERFGDRPEAFVV